MAKVLALLIFFLLFCCGSKGRIILGIVLVLLFIAATKCWLLLILLLILTLIAIVLILLHDKESIFNKKVKHNTNTPKSLEINNETINKLVKLVGRMPNDGTPISQSNVKGVTSVEWDLYLDWFRRNAKEYVVVSEQNTVQVKSKTDKIRLTHKLLKMKTDLLWESSNSYL